MKPRTTQWSWELPLLPLLFTLSGICFTLMVLTPHQPPPLYVTYNALWGTAGVLLLAVGTYLTFRLKTTIHALHTQQPPEYHHLNCTFLIIFLILLLMLLVADIGIIFYTIGILAPPPPI